MSGVLLITVPSPLYTTNPPLGPLYLAAALRTAGIEVRLLDLASLHGARDVGTLEAAINDQRPEILGVTLFTETAIYAYDFLKALGPRKGMQIVAGGPHATAEPHEVLGRGFDLVVCGEGEQTLVELIGVLRNGGDISSVAGLSWLDDNGNLKNTEPRILPQDLDCLPSPLKVLDLYERDRYIAPGIPGIIAPAIITSRGCPGRCTFCANQISGNRYRYHSTQRVMEEVRGWQQRENAVSFFFHDTAFTADSERLADLCRDLKNLDSPVTWTCQSRCDHLDQKRAEAMAEAGCISVFFGVESGDAGVLKRIGKGITLDDIENSLIQAKNAGIRTFVHIMLGFPDETVAELDATYRLMVRLAPIVDNFCTHGILIPYPETAIYRRWHREIGCTRWWFDRGRIESLNVPRLKKGGRQPSSIDEIMALHEEIENGLLQANLVPYDDEVRRAIDRCLVFRREHNRRILELPIGK